MFSRSWVLSVMLGLGLLLTWVGERVVDAGTARMVATGLGVLLVVGSVLLRALRRRSVQPPTAGDVERTLLWQAALALGALCIYFLTSDVFARAAGTSLDTVSPKLSAMLTVLWPVLLACAALPTLFVELSYAAMAKAPVLELERIREARLGGLGLAFTLIFAFSMQYVLTERDAKADFSYFRVAKPGDATKKQVAALDAKVEVALFFAPGNDVGELVQTYFDELKAEGPLLEVSRYDSPLEPAKSKEFGVSSNGAIVVRKGARKETLGMGTEMEKARTGLRSLDADFQKRLLQVAKSRRTVYFTQGHGERTRDPIGGADQRATVDAVYRELQAQNFEVRPLSAADGLGTEVPTDAAAVFIVSPTQAFAEPEAAAIAAYAQRGGRLFVALDPESGLEFKELVAPLGLKFSPTMLADEKSYMRTNVTQTPADRYNVFTKTFSSHPSVSYLGRSNAVFFTLGAGAVDELSPHPAELTIDFPARTAATTFNDENHNFVPDVPPEVKKSYGLIAAVSKRAKSGKADEELRALVVGDSDFMADALLRQAVSQGNVLFIIDGLKWLVGDEQLVGTTNSEVDVPITRSRAQDSLWFFLTAVLVPLVVVAAGFFARRRTNRPRANVTAKEATS